MIVFIVLAALLTLAVAAVLARPLLRRMEPPPAPTEHGQAVYRDQLAELERDVERGLVTKQEETAARAEIGRRMLASGKGEAPRATARTAAGPARGLAAAALIAPLLAAGLYLLIGRPGTPDLPLEARLEAGETRSANVTPQLEAAIAELSEQVRRNPDDLESRLMLGRGLAQAGNYEPAMEQFETAIEQAGDNASAQMLAEYGQIRVMAQGFVDQQAIEAFQGALEADPGNAQARFFLAEALLEGGEYALAIRLWSELTQALPPDSPMANAARQRIQIARQRMAAEEQPGAAPAPQGQPEP